MAARGGSRTPGKPLRDMSNMAATPYGATGKKGSKSYDDNRTVDVGALLRGKLHTSMLVPKLRGQQENQPEAGAPLQPRSPAMQPNPCYSPDDSLQQAASKLANLRKLTATQPAAAGSKLAPLVPRLDLAQPAAAEPSQAPATHDPEPQSQLSFPQERPAQAPLAQAAEPAAPPPASPTFTASPSPGRQQRGGSNACAAAADTPGYRPEAEPRCAAAGSGEGGGGGEEVPLAARTAIAKRHRRKSVHRVERFGEWFSGDDAELDQTLQEYNRPPADEPRMTRAQRRKSALPALGRSLAAADLAAMKDGEAAAAVPKREASEEGGGAQDVAAKVQAITSELCDRLDSLIEASPKEKGRKRKNEDERSLHEKLVEAWDGKSYYDRLKELADKDEQPDGAAAQAEAAQPAAPAGGAAAGKRPPRLQIDLPAGIRTAPNSTRAGNAKTPGRARREQQLGELTESLRQLQMASGSRTSKAAAALAGRVRSAPGSRSASPSGAALPAQRLAVAAKQQDAEEQEAPAPAQQKERAAEAAAAAIVTPTTAAKAPAMLASAAAAAQRAGAAQQASPAASKPVRQEAVPPPSMRVTRAKSRSPEPSPLAESLPKARGSRKAAAASPLGPGASPAAKQHAGGSSEAALRAELEAANKLLNAAVEARNAAEGEAKELKAKLAAEKQAKKAAQQQADDLAAQLKEEAKARKAAERKAKELAGQLEELQRAKEHAEGLERVLSRVGERALESAARHAAAEAQVAALLKAANGLVQQLGQGKEEAHALHELATGRGEGGAQAGGGGGGSAPGSARPVRQQPARHAQALWR